MASDSPDDELCQIEGIDEKVLAMTKAPSEKEMSELDPIYISYFIPWNSVSNYQFAKKRGFHDLAHEWDRSHHIENFDQIDSRAYLVHSWMKYPKFGHASATDYAARYVRYGLMTREEAIDAVRRKDGDLDNKCVEDFIQFMGYTEKEFWDIVDQFYNRDLFEKDEFDRWVLKNPIWK